MLANYLKVAWRNIWKSKTFSLINIFGLSVSMSLGLLIILIIREQNSYDVFEKDVDRIYRINTDALRTDGASEKYASVPLPVATSLKENYALTDDVVRINSQLNGDITYKNVTVSTHGFFADPSFLNFFNLKLKKGDPATALSSPNNIVLSEQASKKIFGNSDPIGKTLKLNGYGDFIVTGLLDKLPGKTHLDFEVLASALAIPGMEQQKSMMPSLNNWINYYSGYAYFKLKKNKTPKEVERALTEIYKKNYPGRQLETRDKGYTFYLQPLSKITPGPELSNQMGRALPKMVSDFMAVLAAIIIIMAGLNYTNLMIAKSLKRAKEIGVRKVMGAGRRQVFLQFIAESILFSILALSVSYLILQFLKPAILQFHIASEFSLELKEEWKDYLLFFGFALVVGFIAGLIPAGYLSGFKPITVLKDAVSSKSNHKINFRKILIGTQFTLSLIFVVGVLIVNRQINYVLNADYGFSQKNILNLRLQGNDYEKLSNAVGNIAGVKQVGAVSHSLGTFNDRSSDYKKNKTDAPFLMRDFIADENYIDNLQLKFLAGKNFQPSSSNSVESEIILNQTALKYFGFSDPASAIGQTVFADDTVQLTVAGVLKDFNFRPLSYGIGPLAFRNKRSEFSILSISIEPGSKDNIIAAIQPVWKSMDPVHSPDIRLMEEEIDDAYILAGFTDILKILGYISFLAIALACLGMLGMVMYNTQLRVKEIGIRKVLGASVRDLSFLLGRSFINLIVISIVVGVPCSYFFGNFFLQTFAYRAPGLWWMILSGVLIICFLAAITIFSQTIKAALSNPVKNLRTE